MHTNFLHSMRINLMSCDEMNEGMITTSAFIHRQISSMYLTIFLWLLT